MKKLIIILGILLAIPMVSYTVVDRVQLLYNKQVNLLSSGSDEIQIRRIDGCEYIIASVQNNGKVGTSIIHKANCPNHK